MKTKRIIALILAAILAFGLFGCSKKGSVGKNDKDPSQTTEQPGNNGAENSAGDSSSPEGDEKPYEPVEKDTSAPAVWTETTTVSENMFVYFYNSFYRYFVDAYASSLSSMGLDPTKSLSSQVQSEDYTWQQYMTIQVYDQLCEMMALADAAKAEGMTLTSEDNATVSSQMSAFTVYAANSGCTVKEYLEASYGKGVNEDAVKKALELRLLANKYYEKLWNGYSFTEEECREHYEKSGSAYLHFDCIKITVPPEDSWQLTSATDEESFVEGVRKAITKNNFLDDYDRFADSIEDAIKRKYNYCMGCDTTTPLGAWVMEPGRKPYDIHTKTESSGNITVTMILPTTSVGAVNDVVYRNDVATKNFRYIVFEDGESFTGKTKADTIYKNWSENPTAERFEELCGEYGGKLAKDISRGNYGDSVNNWIFSSERAAGDCAVIEGDGCAYLIYMLENGDPAWLVDVRASLRDAAFDEDLKTIMGESTVNYNSDFVYNIVEVTIATQESTEG